jgi:hypothetical protein
MCYNLFWNLDNVKMKHSFSNSRTVIDRNTVYSLGAQELGPDQNSNRGPLEIALYKF